MALTKKEQELLRALLAKADAQDASKAEELRTWLGKGARNDMRKAIGAKAGVTLAEQTKAVKTKARKWLVDNGYDAERVAKGLHI